MWFFFSVRQNKTTLLSSKVWPLWSGRCFSRLAKGLGKSEKRRFRRERPEGYVRQSIGTTGKSYRYSAPRTATYAGAATLYGKEVLQGEELGFCAFSKIISSEFGEPFKILNLFHKF